MRESSTLLRLRNVPARRRRTRETATVVFGPVAVLLLLNLIYAAFGDGWFDSTGWIELVLWPAGAMLLGQLAVSAFARDVAEKKVEMLEVCGASREAYLAAFLVEFAAVGLLGAVVAAYDDLGFDARDAPALFFWFASTPRPRRGSFFYFVSRRRATSTPRPRRGSFSN